MKLTVLEIRFAKKLMRETGDVNPDGRPVLRVMTGKEVSALNWFDKNTKAVSDKYNEFVDTKKKEIEEKYKVEKEEEQKAIRSVREMLSKFNEKKKKGEKLDTEEEKMKAAFEAVTGLLQRTSVDFKVNQELNALEELQKEFKEVEHEVEIKENTMELLKKCINEGKFTAEDSPVATLIDKIL